MTLDRLTDEIVEWEAQRTATQSPPDRREIREQLHDVDLPALDERGVIGFNSDEGMVGRYDGEHEETATPRVDETGERVDSWQSALVSNRRLTVAGAVLVTVSLTVATAAVLDPVVAAGVFGGAAAVLTAGMAAYRLS